MKYAEFDSTATQQPTPVIGWYHVYDAQTDPDGFVYPSLPAATDLLELTDAEWAARTSQAWYVQEGALVSAPPLSSAQELSNAQSAKHIELAAACQSQILSGFTSAGLGSSQSYGSQPTDQSNINTAAAAGGGSLWCADNTGAWSFVAHTAAQAAQVQKDMLAHIQATQSHYASLYAQAKAATTVAEVQLINW